MTTCCCKIPENVTSEVCCPPTCCPRSRCITECKTEACKICGCCATTCPCCASESGKKVVKGKVVPHPECKCASSALEGDTELASTACGCPLVAKCECGDKCEKCECKHEKVK
uniref:Cystein-Rich Protein (CRP) family 2 n=1 Tax=uncultured eukaryote TaxID=100272 RepID=K7ZWD8_9EUKA|nr:Cystein-Rich Protein (CRP) family 2 [uncultured eukaryote]